MQMRLTFRYVEDGGDRYGNLPLFEVYDHGEFVGVLIDDVWAARMAWYFYVDGDNHHYPGNPNIWWLCDTGEEREKLAIWKFRRMFYNRVHRRRIAL